MGGIRSEIDFRILGNGWGCGFCGMVGPPAPMCCDKGREWCLRFARQLRDEQDRSDEFYATGEAKPSLVDEHDDARWGRVARRWNHKHRRAGGLNDRERAYVWRCWLEQQMRRREYEHFAL